MPASTASSQYASVVMAQPHPSTSSAPAKARSSRRTRGSTGPPVLLGGGAGVLGTAPNKVMELEEPQQHGSYYYTRPRELRPPSSSQFPVQFPSPVSPTFSTSVQSSSPLPPNMPTAAPVTIPTRYQQSTASNNSLSTTASTSSRTLKTPASKPDPRALSITIASSSRDTLDYGSPSPRLPRLKEADHGSPTHSRMLHSEARHYQKPPALTQSPLPLPPTMPVNMDKRGSARPSETAQPRQISKHLTTEQRLSQDWISVPFPGSSPDPKARTVPPPHAPPHLLGEKWAQATMVPMKTGSPSPSRPVYERANTAPPLSPTKGQEYPRARSSMDYLRSSSPTPGPRTRMSSMSTPPQAVLDAAGSSSGGRLNFLKPELKHRRSEDLLRPSGKSMDEVTGMSKKDLKAAQKEAQRLLGASSSPIPQAEERKTSGLSLKKSSGALKALFNRGVSSKGKERVETPPVPFLTVEDRQRGARPSTAPVDAARPSFSRLRPSTPGEMDRPTRPSLSAERSMSDTVRTSLSLERGMSSGPMQRTASQGSHPVMSSLPLPTRSRLPLRDLPALPPVSPVPPREPRLASTPAPRGASSYSTLAEALPASSLPYLGLRASVVLDGSPVTSSPLSPDLGPTTTSPDSSASKAKPNDSPRVKPSRSLHLLQLPEMDLDFDVPFDSFNMSPPTPHKMRSPTAGSPKRSLTTRISASPKVKPLSRTASERRRSQSFDGVGSQASVLEDLWGNNSNLLVSPMEKFFASNSASSTPMLSKPLSSPLLLSSPTTQPAESTSSHSHSFSFSSQPPSFDHARTPSNASSTQETPSPSPPRTPPGGIERALAGLGFGEFDSPGGTTPTPSVAPGGSLGLGKPFVLNVPPSIPLPATPEPVQQNVLSSPALIEVPKEEVKMVARRARENKVVLQSRSRVVSGPGGMSSKALGREIERLLYAFRYPSQNTTSSDRANLIRNDLLPLLVEVDKRPFDPRDEPGNAALREVCFHWAEVVLLELKVEQAANERGACLEGLAAVMESSCLSEQCLRASMRATEEFEKLMMQCMVFVMSKLGAKGVFHNTLLFSGRFLAFAFFRVPHVGEQLVTVLQPPRGALMRFTRAALLGTSIPPTAQPLYPKHLLPLCFDESRAYTARLASLSAEFATEEQRDAFLFQPGNWLRRWQSDDSELFPAFYRAYHRQLAIYLAPAVQYYESLDQPLPAHVLLRAPGYAHLATIFAKKCHSYILGSVNAVTTSSSAQSFEATETAGFRGSQKPAVLETANRRLVETMSTFAGLKVMMPGTHGRVIECDGSQLYTSMLDLWTKSIISKTSLYAPKGVFSLFDLLDGIVDAPYDLSAERDLTANSLLDVPHLIHVIRMIMIDGEHALTLVKAIAFVFTHWEVLTARPEDRRELCLELFLEKGIFERLLLFWSQSVRSYVLRLVVFRLGHLHTTKEDGGAHDVEIESVRLLQTRLDRIKKRHDELEPNASTAEEPAAAPITPTEGSFSMSRSKSTITMVTESPRSAPSNKAERLLGLGLGSEMRTGHEGEVTTEGGKKGGKAANWLKKSFGNKKKKESPALTPSPQFISPNMDTSPSFPSSPRFRSAPLPLQGYTSPNMVRQPSPVLPSPSSAGTSDESASPTLEGKKSRPPMITTTSPISNDHGTVNSPNSFAFEFELPTMSPRSDTFDPAPTSTSPRRNSQPPSPRQHMSRSFSKRESLLPPPTATALARETSLINTDSNAIAKMEEDRGYDKRLHAYAIRMLAELEDAQKEYDEWWADGGVGRVDGCPPRLTVAWPFHEGEE